jgi:hypothetical protein
MANETSPLMDFVKKQIKKRWPWVYCYIWEHSFTPDKETCPVCGARNPDYNPTPPPIAGKGLPPRTK